MLTQKVKWRGPAVVGKGRGHTPIRTCVSCGAKKPKRELIRLAADEANLVRHDLGSGKGKGAYICDTQACREQLVKAGRLRRAFRGTKRLMAFAPLEKSQNQE
jgi:predicted RNA-binding protein YlxR (DUF448 family)